MKTYRTILILYFALLTFSAVGQSFDLKGQIVDKLGKGIEDVTITRVGQNTKTQSTSNGFFELMNIDMGDTLRFEHIGYSSTQYVVRSNQFVQITFLDKYLQLDVVEVNTGYQTLPKERSTGSFTTINEETFNRQVSIDVLSRLEATANGLTVDRGTTPVPRITVRGLSTIRGPKDALIIVDNFPYEGNIDNINPNDVQSITILKDAAAASIWGARAGNGVIVITTKKSKEGQPFTIGFNSNLTIGKRPDLSYVRQMSSTDFIDVERYLYDQGHYTSWINSSNKRALSDVVEILIRNPANAEDQINSLRKIDVRDYFGRYLYRTSSNQQYAMSFSGGTDSFGWRASIGHDRNISNLDAKYGRTTVRLHNTYRPIKRLQLFGEINYTGSDQSSGKPGYGSIIQGGGLLPYARFADQEGSPLPIVMGHSNSYLETIGDGRLLDWKFYPLEDYKSTPSKNSVHDLVINTGASFNLLDGLDLDLRYQYERQIGSDRRLYDQGSYYARDLINSFTEIDADGKVTNNVPIGGILDQSSNTMDVNNFRGQLNFSRTWQKHEIHAIMGSETRLKRRTGNSNRGYGYNNENLSFGTVDYRNPYPDFISGNLNYIPDNLGLSDQRNNFISTFANASYSYDRKYSLSLSVRRDASNLFGLRTNDQWNPFWSIGTSWELSNENFYNWDVFPYVKMRGTYGFSGNIDPNMSAVTTIFYVTNSPYTLSPFSRFENYHNPDLRWETSKMLNLGIDFRIKGDIISGSIEYYRKKGDNLFGEALIDYTSGVGNTIIKNIAAMRGNGMDIELKSNNLKGRVNWQTSLNLSYYRDMVTDYYLNSTQASNFVTSNVPISGVAGRPVYSIFAYWWAGLDPQTGDPQGYSENMVSKDYNLLTGSGTKLDELRYFGSAIPTYFGSIGNTVTYKGLSINFALVYKFGYYYRRNSINYWSLFENWNGHFDYAMRWQKPGDESITDVPSMVYPANSARDAFYRGSEVLVEKADHIRLQYLNINYRFEGLLGNRSPFTGLELYVNASNLGILWRANNSKIDPDYNYTSSALPNTASYSVGIRANMRK